MQITKRELNEKGRISFPASIFGTYFPFRVEPAIFAFADRLSEDYSGALWRLYELSNHGFYMAPDEDTPFRVSAENGYSGIMSADVFGLTVCLYAYSNLAFTDDELLADEVTEQYYLLREYMFQHPDSQAILAAID